MEKAPAGTAAEGWVVALDGAARRNARDGEGPVFFQEDREDLLVEGDGRRIETTHTRATGVAARFQNGARSSFLSDAGPEDLDLLARAAMDGWPPRAMAGSGVPPPESVLDGRRAGHLVRSTVGAALAERGGPEIVAVRSIYVAMRQTIRVARPDAATAVDVRHGERIRVEVTVRSRETTARAAGERVLRRGRDPGLEVLARGIAVRAALRLDAAPVLPGTYPAVFAPGVGGILVHEIVGHALEADVVLRGASRLAAETGRVAGPAVRILDDPRRARVAWRVDDEGTPSRAVALLEGGRVAGCLHDRSTAGASGEGATGHGRCASFRDPVLPRMGCTFLAAGSARPEDAFEGVREGLLIRRMAAAAADPSSGRAVFRVEDADRIAEGRIAGAVAPFLFEVDALPAMRSIDVVADDLDFDTCVGSCARDGQPLAISVGAPTCRLGSIRVLA